MSSHIRRPGRLTILSSWLPTVLFVGIAVAAGFYLAGVSSSPQIATNYVPEASPSPTVPAGLAGAGTASDSAAAHPREDNAPAAKLHCFPLTAEDIKDSHGAPELAVDGAGRVYLVWSSQTGETERTGFLAASTDGGESFSSPRTIVKSQISFTGGRQSPDKSQENGKKRSYPIHLAPHVVAGGDALHVAWTETVPDESTVRMVVVDSKDASGAFSEPRCVHADQHASPTYTALALGPLGELACCWLDNRAKTKLPYASVRPPTADQFLPEFKLPGGENGKGICPCCPTSATFASDGTLYVGFRDLVNGYRDISIARLRPGSEQFEGPFPIVPPTWKFDGCPHDGPSLIIAKGLLHATWMDAHTGVQRVYHGRASLEDLEFDVHPLHPEGPGTQGNARLFADALGEIHAVWEESLDNEMAAPASSSHEHRHGPARGGSGGAICYAVAPAGAGTFQFVGLLNPVAGSYQTRPAIAGGGKDRICVAWCELDEKGKSIFVTSFDSGKGLQITQGVSR